MPKPILSLSFTPLVAAASICASLLQVGCAGSEPVAAGDDLGEGTLAVLPPGCAKNARVFSYDPVGWEHIAAAFAANPSPCADYYLHLPAYAGDKKSPRGPDAVGDIHALGARFHALAELHYGQWSTSSSLSWYDKGVDFRRRMKDAGYVDGVDAWSINELPSTVRSDPNVRAHVRDLVRGLYEGPTGAADMGGLVFVVGMGSPTENFSVYKPNLEDWLTDSAFWEQMDLHVRWWGQEVYPDPLDMCVSSATVAARAERLGDYTMHPAILAAASGAPSSTSAARAFFDESYTPLMSAFFRSDQYGTATISLTNMKAFASLEVYAARTYANTHDAPDWHLGFSWNEHPDGVSDADLTALADRVAAAVRDGYPEDARSTSQICGGAAYTACHCNMAGAAFNDDWKALGSW